MPIELNLSGIKLPVYSHLLWNKFDLYPHQYLALEKKPPFLIEVPCGFGKTFAAILPSLIDDTTRTFFVFPSNALVETQHNSIRSRLKQWGKEKFVPLKITGDSILENMIKKGYSSKGDALWDMATQELHNIIFTNIDVMFNLISQKYRKGRDLFSLFKSSRIIFDEFHFYKNISAVLLGAMYKHLIEYTQNIYFLSATPSEKIITLLNSIKPFPSEKVTINSIVDEREKGTRSVIYPTKLIVEEFSDNKVNDALNYVISKYDENVGMVILDSIRDSIILSRKLKDEGIETYVYTGLVKDNRLKEDIQKGVIVGTSAIEVGIDKEIDFLFFEARNTTSFLQRFGRIGRHPSESIAEAYALVHPDIFYELKQFDGTTTLPRMDVLNSITRSEYRFDYSKLYFNSDFSTVLNIIDKIYDPDARLSQKEKELLQNLNVRDGVSIFVFDSKTKNLYLYDVLRIIRDYKTKIVEYKDIMNCLDGFSKEKFEYFSKFNYPIIVEVDDIESPNEDFKFYPNFDGVIFQPAFPAVRFAFESLKRQKLFKKVLLDKTIREEGCLQIKDHSNKNSIWVWGYSSKLV